jgi:hypothetical protein
MIIKMVKFFCRVIDTEYLYPVSIKDNVKE